MSEKPIGVGDTVIVVRGCPVCGDASDVGRIFCVDEIEVNDFDSTCCGDSSREVCAAAFDMDVCFQLSVLKRIDPLPESERTNTTDEVTA